MQIAFPYGVDARGRTASTDDDTHVRDLIEAVLFTTPGERVNRPSFGSGLLQAMFAPNSDEMAATLNFLVQGALQQWLGDVIVIQGVLATSQDSTLSVTVRYLVKRTNQNKVSQFTRTV